MSHIYSPNIVSFQREKFNTKNSKVEKKISYYIPTININPIDEENTKKFFEQLDIFIKKLFSYSLMFGSNEYKQKIVIEGIRFHFFIPLFNKEFNNPQKYFEHFKEKIVQDQRLDDNKKLLFRELQIKLFFDMCDECSECMYFSATHTKPV
jgi:hypothetical protein